MMADCVCVFLFDKKETNASKRMTIGCLDEWRSKSQRWSAAEEKAEVERLTLKQAKNFWPTVTPSLLVAPSRPSPLAAFP